MKKIPLTQGKFAVVDDEDYDMLMEHKWHAAKYRDAYYAARSASGKTVLMHKILTGFAITDHIDGNGLNNQRKNLREATNSTNGMNRGKQANNTSGHKGVCWHKSAGKWEAKIGKGGKTIHLGRYTDKSDAISAYDKATLKYHGEFARCK